MRKLLLFLALVNAFALAASAQTPGHGLTLSEPEWVRQDLAASSKSPVGRRRGGAMAYSYGQIQNPANSQPHIDLMYQNARPDNTTTAPRMSRPGGFRRASVAVTNDGAKAVKSVRLDFVFTDPATGAEVNRIHHRSKKTLRPGETAGTTKEVIGSARHRRGDGMEVSVEVTEVVYEDGSVWRR